MIQARPVFEFSSDLFAVEPPRDTGTLPPPAGRALAEWLRERLAAGGVPVQDVFADDRGWCVRLQRRPFHLWIACWRAHDDAAPPTALRGLPPIAAPSARATWTCTIETLARPWTAFFWRRLARSADTWVEVQQAARQLQQVLLAEPRIRIELIEGL